MKEIHNNNYEEWQINDAANILKCVIEPLVYTKAKDFEISFALSKEPVPFDKRLDLTYSPIAVGQRWGKEVFDCAWFHLHASVKDLKQKNNLYIAFDINGEALLFDRNGNPLKGFTNGSSTFDRGLGEPKKAFYPLDKSFIDEEGNVDLYFDCGFNDLFGNIQNDGKIEFAYLAYKDVQTEDISYDYSVLLDLLTGMDRKSPFFKKMYDGLIEVRDLYWYNTKDKYVKAKKITSSLLGIKSKSKFTAICVGHSHLDLAWLWPVRESKRKAVRTISNVLYLMKKYPEFHFVISQPQQLIWIKENAPLLFKDVVKYEKAGRIELVGGAFVESDTNLVSEEELSRQMLYGQKFYQENFGHYSSILWLPDTFGYSGSLPQIMKLSNQQYFMTTKISWNTVNKFPYHNFIWEGIDGSKVITHFPPEGTYNSGISPKSLRTFANNIKDEKTYDKGLVVYGIGDGAGGPGDEHLERIKREHSLCDLPKAEIDSAENFFKGLKKDKELPIHQGELYLENHQGTYTSQSEIKRYNRYLGEKVKAIESFLASKDIHDEDEVIKKEIYPKILLFEFHDILPGSAISRVYQETLKEYKEIDKKLDNILTKHLPSYNQSYKEGDTIYNHLSYPVNECYKFNDSYYQINIEPFQSSSKFLKYPLEKEIKGGKITTKNFKISFDSKGGYLTSIIDQKTKKEILNGYGNKLRVFRDHGDAWNILPSYRNQDEVLMKLESRKINKYGPLYEINSFYSLNKSTVSETILIDDESSLIRFHDEIDWQDNGYMLHSAFKTNIKAKEATCDIQFGNIKRSRKNDTGIEKAQFEVCAQNYVDISDKNYGISLINNVKSGYFIKDDNLELNLIRSTNYPCQNGDIGKTSCSYAIYLHDSDMITAKVDQVANIFNSFFIISEKADSRNIPYSFKNDDIEVSCFKPRYDSKPGYILRLYERNGAGTVLNLDLDGYRIKQIDEVNLLEDVLKENLPKRIRFKPFEVKTLWLK